MLEEILIILYRPILNRIGDVMASAQELQGKVDALSANLTTAKNRITEDVQHLRDLLEQRVDPATLDAVSSALDQINASVQAIDPDPDNPPPAPEPTP